MARRIQSKIVSLSNSGSFDGTPVAGVGTNYNDGNSLRKRIIDFTDSPQRPNSRPGASSLNNEIIISLIDTEGVFASNTKEKTDFRALLNELPNLSLNPSWEEDSSLKSIAESLVEGSKKVNLTTAGGAFANAVGNTFSGTLVGGVASAVGGAANSLNGISTRLADSYYEAFKSISNTDPTRTGAYTQKFMSMGSRIELPLTFRVFDHRGNMTPIKFYNMLTMKCFQNSVKGDMIDAVYGSSTLDTSLTTIGTGVNSLLENAASPIMGQMDIRRAVGQSGIISEYLKDYLVDVRIPGLHSGLANSNGVNFAQMIIESVSVNWSNTKILSEDYRSTPLFADITVHLSSLRIPTKNEYKKILRGDKEPFGTPTDSKPNNGYISKQLTDISDKMKVKAP